MKNTILFHRGRYLSPCKEQFLSAKISAEYRKMVFVQKKEAKTGSGEKT